MEQAMTNAYFGQTTPQSRTNMAYQHARRTWRTQTEVRLVALDMGMTEREYCDRLAHEWLATHPFTWTSSERIVVDYDAAFAAAGEK